MRPRPGSSAGSSPVAGTRRRSRCGWWFAPTIFGGGPVVGSGHQQLALPEARSWRRPAACLSGGGRDPAVEVGSVARLSRLADHYHAPGRRTGHDPGMDGAGAAARNLARDRDGLARLRDEHLRVRGALGREPFEVEWRPLSVFGRDARHADRPQRAPMDGHCRASAGGCRAPPPRASDPCARGQAVAPSPTRAAARGRCRADRPSRERCPCRRRSRPARCPPRA